MENLVLRLPQSQPTFKEEDAVSLGLAVPKGLAAVSSHTCCSVQGQNLDLVRS